MLGHTTARTPARLLVDPPRNAAWNMAVDEYLLHSVEASGLPALRFYRWSEPSLSLGYFQRHQDRQHHLASRDCPLVRRSSGGGAILHHREITYSLAVPHAHRWSRQAQQLYEIVHACLVRALADWGIEAEMCGHAGEAGAAAPFLCFQRRSLGDLLVGGHKVLGSAQRRHQGALLQHGSLLWDRSPAAPELPGLAQLTPHPLDFSAWLAQLPSYLADVLALELTLSRLAADELRQVACWQERKFAARSWTEKR